MSDTLTKDEMWKQLVERHPKFEDPEHVLKMKANGLRNLIIQAWEQGHDAGVKNGKALAAMGRERKAKDDPLRDFFRGYGFL